MARKRARSDQRKWQRIPLAIPVFIRGVDEQGRDFLEFATALNISAGGALVATRRQLPRCARLSLEIPVAPMPRAITLPKSVRRMRAKLVRVTLGESYQLWGLGGGMSFRFIDPALRTGLPWTVSLTASNQWWHYDAPDSTVDPNAYRDQSDFIINLTLAIPFDERTTFSLSGGRFVRSATLPNYAFDNNNVMFGVSWRF